eukprot:322942-Chlamydomonas_euryale.AAC.2
MQDPKRGPLIRSVPHHRRANPLRGRSRLFERHAASHRSALGSGARRRRLRLGMHSTVSTAPCNV